MINRYAVLLGLLSVGFAAYSIWWYQAAGTIPARLQNQVAHAMPSNVEAKFTVGEVEGYPFRFIAPLENLQITIGGTDRFSTPEAEVFLQPFNNGHIILRFAEPVSYSVEGAGSGTIIAEQALASIVRMDELNPQIDLDSLHLHINGGSGDRITADRFGLHVRDGSFARRHVYQFALSAEGLRRGGPDNEAATLDVEGKIEHRDIARGGAATVGFVPRALSKIEITHYAFALGDMHFNQTYSADFSNKVAPVLRMQASLSPAKPMLDAMHQEDVMNSGTLADLMARYGKSDGKDGLTLGVDYRGEALTVNGQHLPQSDADAFFSLF